MDEFGDGTGVGLHDRSAQEVGFVNLADIA
jgi:hypothetical protein